MPTYAVDAGRLIRKDGFAFVSICKEGRTKPVEADEFVRVAAAAPELLDVLQALRLDCKDLIPEFYLQMIDTAIKTAKGEAR